MEDIQINDNEKNETVREIRIAWDPHIHVFKHTNTHSRPHPHIHGYTPTHMDTRTHGLSTRNTLCCRVVALESESEKGGGGGLVRGI